MYADVFYIEDSLSSFSRSFKYYIEEQRLAINKINEITDMYYEMHTGLNSEKENIISDINNSLIISIYGKCESLFNTLCLSMERALGINLNYSSLRSSGFNRALNYLEGVNLIKRTNIKSYDKINSWRFVRNHLTHDYAIPDEKNRKHIEKTKVFWCGETEALHATKENCSQFLVDIELLFAEVENEILSKLQNKDE